MGDNLRTRFRRIGTGNLGLSVSEKGPSTSRLGLSVKVVSALADNISLAYRSNISYHGCNKLSKVSRTGRLLTSVVRIPGSGIVVFKGSDLGIVCSAMTHTVARNVVKDAP